MALLPSATPAFVETLLQQRRFAEAERACGALIAAHPREAGAWLLAGRVARADGRVGVAVERFQRAAQLAPERADAWRALGGAAAADRQLDVAELSAQRLTELEPAKAEAWFDLGQMRWLKRMPAEARDAYSRAVALDPGHLRARWMLAHVPPTFVFEDEAALRRFRDEWVACIAHFEGLDASDPATGEQIEAAVNLLPDYYLQYLGDAIDADHRRWGAMIRRHASVVRPDAVPAARAAPRAKIRVGFVSASFYRHSVSKVFERLVTALPSQFEVVLFQIGRHRDEVTERFLKRASAHVAANAGPATWRKLILDQHVDVLVYPDVGLDGVVSWLAAQRLAPVQVALWGHPHGTGLGTIDHFVSADAMEREDAQADYVEKLTRLPALGCWFELPNVPKDLPPRDGAPGARYVVAQNVSKLTPRHDPLFARILAGVPNGWLDVIGLTREDLRRALDERMRRAMPAEVLGADRFAVLPRLDARDFFARIAHTDVNLDTIGFSGCISSFEIFALDTPTVTLPGRSMRSRQTAAMLGVMEIPQLIARDEDDYVRIAVELGKSANFRAEMRGRIAERKHRLYRDDRVPAAFADLLARVATPAA